MNLLRCWVADSSSAIPAFNVLGFELSIPAIPSSAVDESLKGER
jgi:hypothetical protein